VSKIYNKAFLESKDIFVENDSIEKLMDRFTNRHDLLKKVTFDYKNL
jgi:hypothetical protein